MFILAQSKRMEDSMVKFEKLIFYPCTSLILPTPLIKVKASHGQYISYHKDNIPNSSMSNYLASYIDSYE